MLKVFCRCFFSDLYVVFRSTREWLSPVLFFMIFVALFGIGLGFDGQQLIQISPMIIWVAFLLTSLFTTESIFRADLEEGILEQLALSPYPLWWLLLAKSFAFWIASSLPLMLLMPFVGIMMQLPVKEIILLVVTLFLGSPAITMVGVLGATLTITLPRSGIFLGILLLPLYVPILILGQSAIINLFSQTLPLFQIALLGAISLLCITLIPHAAAAALKTAMNE